MQHLKTMARHTVVYALAPILARATGFLMLPLYTRLLTPSDYGTLEVLLLVPAFLNIFLGVELIQSMIRLYHSYPVEHDKREVVSTAIIFTGILTTAGVLVADAFRHPIAIVLFGDDTSAHLLRLALWSLVSTNVAYMAIGFFQTRKMSGTSLMVAVIQFIATISFNVLFVVVFGWGVEGILLSQLIVTAALAVGTAGWVLGRLGFHFSGTKLRGMLVFGAPLIGLSLGWFVMNAADRAVLSRVASLADVGIYSLANRLATVLLVFVLTPFLLLWQTERYEVASRERGQEAIARVFTYFFASLCFAALGLSVWMHDVVRLMAAEQFWGAAQTGPVLVLAYCLWGVSHYLMTGLLVERKTIPLSLLASGVAILDILLSIFLGRIYFADGVAWARVIALAVLMLGIHSLAQAVYPIAWEYRRIAIAAGVSLCLFVVSTFLEVHSPLLGIVVKAAFVFAFPLLLACMRFLDAREKRWVKARTKAIAGKLHVLVGV